MPDGRITGIIQMLEQIQERPGLFVAPLTSSSMSDFLSGFDTACYALGLPLPFEMRQQAKEERGWPRLAEVWSVSAMQERGLSDEAIAAEMLCIDIGAWRRMAEAGAV